MVKRLTRDAAEVFGVEAGSIDPGAQADIVLIDPAALANHDGEKSTMRVWRDVLQNDQLVNRSDGVVKQVLIRGETVWRGGVFTEALGAQKLGRVLKARNAVA
jgi:cytosine/adenosine deaminase-related metal-dependent hydrolase